MTSLASLNGPSVTVTLPFAGLCTRKPLAPKLTPSVESSHPSFMASSTSLPMAAISACVGARLLGSCVKILMKRMSLPSGVSCCMRLIVERPAPKSTTGSHFFDQAETHRARFKRQMNERLEHGQPARLDIL